MSEDIEAFIRNEEVWGVVQCNNCLYWGRMEGIIEASNRKVIAFVCRECNSIEYVKNPDYNG
jgi:hypothetical protein